MADVASVVGADSGLPRWAQLSYTSFDPEEGPGGWQVKETAGRLTAAEADELKLRIVTNFDADEPLPQFPTADELNQLPRRFTYVLGADGTAAYWHAVQAGSDGTGRPGNVFSHVLLDRAPGHRTPDVRPIDFWRSADLLVPFGPDRVLAARLGAGEILAPGPASGMDSVLAFLFEPPTWRIGVLCVLLDAIAAARTGGPRVVLVAQNPDSAARWISAVSHLTSAAVSRQLSWSVYERASNLATVWARGVHLAAIPSGDAGKVRQGNDVVIIDELETPSLGELDGRPHQTAAGSSVLVTAWSEMAQMVLIDEPVARATLSQMNDVADCVGDGLEDLAWPLAMAVVLGGEDVEDALIYAQEVVLRGAPANVASAPELYLAAMATVAASAGTTAGEAWNRLSTIDHEDSAAMYAVVARIYLARAVTDRAWLQQPSGAGVPVLSAADREGELRQLGDVTLRAALEVATPTVEDGVYHLRLVDFLSRAGLLDPSIGGLPSTEVAVDLLLSSVVECLRDTVRGPLLVARVGSVGDVVLDGILREAVDAGWQMMRPSPYVPGSVYPSEVVEWMCGGLINDRLAQACRDPLRTCEPLDLEFALWHAGNGDAVEGLTGLITCGLISALGSWERVADRFDLAMSGPHALGIADLLAVERRFPGQLPAPYLRPQLLSAPMGEELENLCRLVAQRSDEPLVQLARLRELCSHARANLHWKSRGRNEGVLRAVRCLTADEHRRAAWDEIAPLFLECTVAEHALTLDTFGFVPEQVHQVEAAAQATSAGEAATRLVNRTVDSGESVLLSGIAYLALATAPGAPLSPTDPYERALGAISVDYAGATYRLLEIPVREALANELVADPEGFAHDVTQRYLRQVHARLDVDAGGGLAHGVPKFAREWWREVGLGSPRHNGSKIFGAFRAGGRKER